MEPKEKLSRFDDVYKLTLTLLTITLTFGTKFLVEELPFTFFVFIFSICLILACAWAVGHLSNNVKSEVQFKLIGWWGMSSLLPLILMNYLLPEIRVNATQFPPHILIPVSLFGLFCQFACVNYLKDFLSKLEKRLFEYGPLTLTIFGILSSIANWYF